MSRDWDGVKMSYPKYIILLYCYTEYTECQAFFPVVRTGFPHPLRECWSSPLWDQGERHTRLGGRGGPISTKGQILWYCNENPIMYSQERSWAASVPISTFMWLWAIFIFPGSVYIFSCSRIGRPIVGIYKSLTETWMWKLGLWPRNSFFENIYYKFSVLCLCSVCIL